MKSTLSRVLSLIVLVAAASFLAPQASAEELVWIKAKDGHIPPGAVEAGKGPEGKLYVCRMAVEGHLYPGTVADGHCRVAAAGRVKAHYAYEVLVRKIRATGGPGAKSASEPTGDPITIYNKSGQPAAIQLTDAEERDFSADLSAEGTLRLRAHCPCEVVELDTARTLRPFRHASGTLVLDWNGSRFLQR